MYLALIGDQWYSHTKVDGEATMKLCLPQTHNQLKFTVWVHLPRPHKISLFTLCLKQRKVHCSLLNATDA